MTMRLECSKLLEQSQKPDFSAREISKMSNFDIINGKIMRRLELVNVKLQLYV